MESAERTQTNKSQTKIAVFKSSNFLLSGMKIIKFGRFIFGSSTRRSERVEKAGDVEDIFLFDFEPKTHQCSVVGRPVGNTTEEDRLYFFDTPKRCTSVAETTSTLTNFPSHRGFQFNGVEFTSSLADLQEMYDVLASHCGCEELSINSCTFTRDAISKLLACIRESKFIHTLTFSSLRWKQQDGLNSNAIGNFFARQIGYLGLQTLEIRDIDFTNNELIHLFQGLGNSKSAIVNFYFAVGSKQRVFDENVNKTISRFLIRAKHLKALSLRSIYRTLTSKVRLPTFYIARNVCGFTKLEYLRISSCKINMFHVFQLQKYLDTQTNLKELTLEAAAEDKFVGYALVQAFSRFLVSGKEGSCMPLERISVDWEMVLGLSDVSWKNYFSDRNKSVVKCASDLLLNFDLETMICKREALKQGADETGFEEWIKLKQESLKAK